MASQKLAPVVLAGSERARLAAWANDPQAQPLALRARIVLACAAAPPEFPAGPPVSRVAAELGLSRDTVRKWRSRFLAQRLAGLRDAPRPGAPRTITDEQVARVIARTLLAAPPVGRARWSTRLMAAETGMSQSAVSRIWRLTGVAGQLNVNAGSERPGTSDSERGGGHGGGVSLRGTAPAGRPGAAAPNAPSRGLSAVPGRLDPPHTGDNGDMGGMQADSAQHMVRESSASGEPVLGESAPGEPARGEHESGERAPGQRTPGERAGSPEHGTDREVARPGGSREGAEVMEDVSGVRPPVGPAEAGTEHADLPPGRYFDREESWLRFNQRVLELAEDETLPLLERVRFLSIFASNLDEFFMVRVAGRMRRMATGLPVEGVTGLPPEEILSRTLETARELSLRHAECYASAVLPALGEEGIEVLRWKELSAAEQEDLQRLFRERIYPVLTPLIVDPAHPFPYISGLSLSLAVMVADPRTGATMFARVKVPPLLPRFLTVSQYRFVPLEDVIAAHLTELFAGLEILEQHVFRVTRTRDLEVDEDVTEDLLQSLERELQRRRFEPAVRLEVEDSISSDVLDKLVTELGIDERAVYRLPGPLDLSGLNVIADLDRRQLKYPAFVPSESALPQDTDIFTALDKQDVLIHLPYDSFTTTVERLIVEAAADPRVLAIKQTLYRTSDVSSIVDALVDAAEAGKQVVVVVELKARFDERANIIWARKLEEAGCHVVYGIVGLKTHCKMVLVVREEPDGSLRRYCHIGTGNYHPTTARLYEDFGLLTADPTVGADATDLYNHLTGYSRKNSYRRFLVAPVGLRTGLLERIAHQVDRHREGKPARIQFKCNSIVDEAMIDALYEASRAGVPVDLWVRGICSIRPGVPGLSETIRVRSILGRFLEHSRIYAFGIGGDEESEVWIGSADLMHRNLDRRVESLVRVKDLAQKAVLRNLVDLAMDENTASWWLAGDGSWARHHLDSSDQPLLDLQQHLLANLRSRSLDA
jgi:polyphosphate kinase